jgi:hypothetical protein
VKEPDENQAEDLGLQSRLLKLKRHRAVQVNFRVSTKWLQIINMLATLEGRSASALVRELLTLGLAQYVSIYYRTPQLVKMQQLKAIMEGRLQKRADQARTKATHKQRV